MEIYLIRHTTPKIEKGICYGQSNLNLEKTFLEEYQSILKNLPSTEDFKIISSPLKRCALLASQFSDTVTFDDRLKELDFGDWELKSWNDIPSENINPWMKDFVNVTVPNGESYINLVTRVYSFFEEIRLSNQNRNLIIVTHAGPIRAFLAKLLAIDLKDSFNIKIEYGRCFHLKKEKNSFKLITSINL